MESASLPDCATAAAMEAAWRWTDPATGRDAMLGDHTKDQSWERGQLIAPPVRAADQPEWLTHLRDWRAECESPLELANSRAISEQPALRWVKSAHVQVQMHPFDRFFYDPETGQYTVERWLADLRARYGGIDAALIWPTYTNLGVDDRNAYDMIRSLPGGVDGLREVVRRLHAANVSVLWPLMPWDVATRYEGPEPASMVELVKATAADGINGDTLFSIPKSFWEESVSASHPVGLQAELGGSLGALGWTTMGWGEAGGWSLDISQPAPLVDAFKFLQPHRRVTVCRRAHTACTGPGAFGARRTLKELLRACASGLPAVGHQPPRRPAARLVQRHRLRGVGERVGRVERAHRARRRGVAAASPSDALPRRRRHGPPRRRVGAAHAERRAARRLRVDVC